MDAYKGGKGSERQLHMSNWSGQPMVVKRRGKDPLVIPNPVLPVTGGLQPAMLHKLAGEATEDGFLQRFLFAWPDTPPMRWNDSEVDESRAEEVAELYRVMRYSPDCGVVSLSEMARRQLRPWYDRVYEAAETLPSLLESTYSKLPQQALRLALVIHCLSNPEAPSRTLLSEDSMAAALELTDYFRQMAHRTLAQFGAAGHVDLTGDPEKVYRRLLAVGAKEEGDHRWRTTGEIGRLMPKSLPAEKYRPALSQLESHGLLTSRPHTSPNPEASGQPTTEWQVKSDAKPPPETAQIQLPAASAASTPNLSSNQGKPNDASTAASTPHNGINTSFNHSIRRRSRGRA